MITSAGVSGGGYVAIPQMVRDFYSREVMFQAQPRLRFLQFAKIREDLTAVRGKSIVFTKYGNLSGGGALAESDVLVPQGMSSSEVSISVIEQANAIQVTEFLLRTSMFNVLADASRLLAANLADVLDRQFRDVVLSTTNVIYGGAGTATPPVTASALALGDGLDAATVKNAVEILATNNAPKIDGEYYVCFAHPHQLRQLRDDPAWINAMTYMGRRQLYLGEAGMYEGVVFIETTNMPVLNSAQTDARYGTTGGPVVYEAAMFGDNAYAWAVALPVELRDDGVVELGRKRTLGWYGIWGAGVLEPDNIVRIATA
jgi:N4-gp56 family major capsid protein